MPAIVASLLFLLMTLGPLIAMMPLVEHARGRLAPVLEVFGRVPLFYYVLHVPLIHLSAIVVSLIRTGGVTPWLFSNFPKLTFRPSAFCLLPSAFCLLAVVSRQPA